MLKGRVEQLLRQRWALPVVLLGAGALLLVSEMSFDQARRAVSETRLHMQARLDMTRLLQIVTDAETAQRGYVLTGSEAFLRPYEAALEAEPLVMQSVLGYLRQTGQAQAAKELAALVEAKLSEVQTTIKLRVSGNEDAARTLVQSGIGKEQMEEMRALVDRQFEMAGASTLISREATVRTLTLNRFGVAALMAALVLGLMLYLQQVRALDKARERERQFLENERVRLEEEVARRTGELRELAQHLQAAREDERASLARELHDELGALLTAAKLDVARLRSKIGDQPEQMSRLAHLTQALNDGIALKRRIIEDLRPSALTNLGLTTALDILCREMADRLALPIVAELEPLELRAPADLTVYRFVQEALTNVGKYANAAEVRVRLALQPEGVTVEVSDDGVGFDLQASMVGHHGLTGMRFRVESTGGLMFVGSAPGNGTTLRATLPHAVLVQRDALEPAERDPVAG
jgi:signal transduction histidine kinase